MNLTIRSIQSKDAEIFWQMLSELDNETKYMLYEPGERTKNIDVIESFIKGATDGVDLLLVAEADNKMVGFISAQRGKQQRIRHTAYIVIGIRKEYQYQGIGGMLFKQLDLWAKSNKLTRLELTVMCPNEVAKRLYKKNGFIVEGIRKNSIVVDGKYIDEYYMAKLM